MISTLHFKFMSGCKKSQKNPLSLNLTTEMEMSKQIHYSAVSCVDIWMMPVCLFVCLFVWLVGWLQKGVFFCGRIHNLLRFDFTDRDSEKQ
jgi:hypothetical protein